MKRLVSPSQRLFRAGGLSRWLVCMIAMSFTGCTGMIARALIPDVKTHLNKEELEHLKGVNTNSNVQLVEIAKLVKDEGLDKKTAYRISNYIYKGGKNASNIKPSALETGVAQYAAMAGREQLEGQLTEGFEWTKKAIGTAAGAAIPGGGMIAGLVALLRRGNRKDRALKVVSSELDENAKAKVKKALEHTGMEREIT